MKRKRMLYIFFGIFGLIITVLSIFFNTPLKEEGIDEERSLLETAYGAKMETTEKTIVDEAVTVTLTNIKGDVFVQRKRDEETTEERVTTVTKLAEGDRLLTKSKSFVELIVNKGERALIGANSEVEIKTLKKINEGIHIVLKQTAGHILHTGQHVSYQVEVGDYVTNAIGTNFFTMIDSTGNPSLSVMSGLVSVSEPGSAESENVTTPILPGLQLTGNEDNEISITSMDFNYLIEHLDVEIIKQIIRLKPVLDEENQELFANNETEFKKFYESILPRIISKVLETGKMSHVELSGLIDEVNQMIDDEDQHLNMDDLTEEMDSEIEITASSLEELFVMMVDSGIIDRAFLHRYRDNLSIPSSVTSSINITPQTSSAQQEYGASYSTVRRNYASHWGNNTGEYSEKRERIREKYKDLINQLERLGDQILYIENGEQSFSLPEFVATLDAVTGKGVGTTKHGIVDVSLNGNRVIMKPLSKGSTSILVSIELEGVIFSTNVNVTVQDKKGAEQAEKLKQLQIDLDNMEDQFLRLSAGSQYTVVSSQLMTTTGLTTSVRVADPEIVTAELRNNRLVMTPKKLGKTTITVEVIAHGNTFSNTITINVYEFPEAPKSITFSDTDPTAASISGTVIIERATNEKLVDNYALYWARNEREVAGVPIAIFPADGSDHQYRFLKGTYLPFNAKGLIVASQNEISKTDRVAYINIKDFQKHDVQFVSDGIEVNVPMGRSANIPRDQLAIVNDAWGNRIWENHSHYEWIVQSSDEARVTGKVERLSLEILTGKKSGEVNVKLVLISKETNEELVEVPIKITVLGLEGPSHIEFAGDTNAVKGFIGGQIKVGKASKVDGITKYRLYWLNSYGERMSHEPFAEIDSIGSYYNLVYDLPSSTKIPVGATSIQAVSSNGVEESKDFVSIDIVDNQELTLFGFMDPFVIQSDSEVSLPLDEMLLNFEKQSPIDWITLHTIDFSGEAISNVTTNSDERVLVFDTKNPGQATITIIGDGQLFGKTYRNLAFQINVVVKVPVEE